MTETLKETTGQSLNETLDLYRRYLDGQITYDEYSAIRREAAISQLRRQQAQQHQRKETREDLVRAFLLGAFLGIAGYALWRESTRG